MKLHESQITILSKYFADLSKILVASTVIAFFLPSEAGPISIPVFLGGLTTAVGFLIPRIREHRGRKPVGESSEIIRQRRMAEQRATVVTPWESIFSVSLSR